MSHPSIVALYGPPGSGKTTQAGFLAERLGFVHFDTGAYLQSLLHSEEAEHDPVLKREQINFDTGKLTTPAWIMERVRRETEALYEEKKSVVFSGSPRTVFEAFGDAEKEGLVYAWTRLYGMAHAYFITIEISEEEAINRSMKRVVCSKGRFPIFSVADEKKCRNAGGKPVRRSLDDPKLIGIRLNEYRERTAPIFERLQVEKFRAYAVDGMPSPEQVFEMIRGIVHGHA